MSTRRFTGFWFFLSLFLVTAGPLAAAVYANLSHDLADREQLVNFPPFRPWDDRNQFDHLGGEYFKIAQSLYERGEYADPFGIAPKTGPTAWMPPVLPLLYAGLLWAFDADKTAVANTVTVLQALTLSLTGALTLLVARRTAPRVPSLVVAGLVALALVTRFHLAFQFTHDAWLVLLAVDFLVAGLVFGRVWAGPWRAAAWGVGGGVCALISPVAGACWLAATVAGGARSTPPFGDGDQRARSPGAGRRPAVVIALVACGLTVAPWVVRNAVVFGRFIPVKSNLAYELYQAQCVSPDGRLTNKVFSSHPFATNGSERAECAEKGEMAFLDAKRDLFNADVRADPGKFLTRVWERLIAATIDYSPMDDRELERETLYTLCYHAHALPAFAAVGLLCVAPFRRLPRGSVPGLAVLALYLAPYVLVSYYERYEFPLWGLKTLVIVWWLAAILPTGEESARPA